ncbi:MAG: hypothetical protein ACQER4_10130, partial [Bacteroidota bacterium]
MKNMFQSHNTYTTFYPAIRTITLLVTLALLVIAGCDTTDPHNDDDDDAHAEPVGFALQVEGETLVQYQNNNTENAEWNPDGTLNEWFRDDFDGLVLSPDVVGLGDSDPDGLTHEIALRWVDEHGDLFDLDSDEEEFAIEWEWEKPNTLEDTCSDAGRTDSESLDQIRPANLLSVDDDHATEEEDDHAHEELEVQFRADHAGTDRVRFLILHGEEGHVDFSTD